MMKLITLILFILSPFYLWAQEGTTWRGCIFPIEEIPQYPGGEQKLAYFIASNIKNPHPYDEFVVDEKIYVHFLVKTDGSLDSIGIVYPSHVQSKYPLYEDEAIRVVRLTDGKWKSGTRNGIPVDLWYTSVVHFKIE